MTINRANHTTATTKRKLLFSRHSRRIDTTLPAAIAASLNLLFLAGNRRFFARPQELRGTNAFVRPISSFFTSPVLEQVSETGLELKRIDSVDSVNSVYDSRSLHPRWEQWNTGTVEQWNQRLVVNGENSLTDAMG